MEIDKNIEEFRARIANLKDFDETFELVKSAVFLRFRMHRAGLSLILQVMPGNLGAYHTLGSNAIVMNRMLLDAVKAISPSLEDYNSYVFMVLAHEYFHTLGIVDENSVRQMTYELCRSRLGESHPATKMAKEDPAALFPKLRSLLGPHASGAQFGNKFEVVKNFDRSTQSYIQ